MVPILAAHPRCPSSLPVLAAINAAINAAVFAAINAAINAAVNAAVLATVLAAVLALHPRYTSSRVLVQSACPRSRACFPAQLVRLQARPRTSASAQRAACGSGRGSSDWEACNE